MLRLIDGDDTAASSLSVAALDEFIRMGESRVVSDFRSSLMMQGFAATPINGQIGLPDDLLELCVIHQDGRRLEFVGHERLNESEKFCTQLGNNLLVSGTGPVSITYYARPADLITVLHPTFMRHRELYLYATVLSAAMHMGLPQLDVWTAAYATQLQQAKRMERLAVTNGTPLRIRSR
ncbi:hypothetical protein V3390_09190 [Luteimonas sp. FXH3W]|uniref:Uncharacterized protein n=1 Tax=Aquilutibacter rugosus TaxID=3115820 RepID=A0ABU7V3D8_9GAMM